MYLFFTLFYLVFLSEANGRLLLLRKFYLPYFTGVYSLYIYLVTKMDDHPGFLSLYKDKGYQDEENERVSDMIDGAQRAKNFLSAEGRNIEL